MIKARIACSMLMFAILCAPAARSFAQDEESVFERIRREHDSIEKSFHYQDHVAASLVASSVEPQSIDVKHYRLQIQFTPVIEAPGIAGTVTITGVTTGTVSAINVDAQPNLSIDSVKLDGAPKDFQRDSTRVIINFSGPPPAGSPFSIAIQYHGVPTTSNALGGGILVSVHPPGLGQLSARVMATHSEP